MTSFRHIFIDESALSHPYTETILCQFPDIVPRIYKDSEWTQLQTLFNRSDVLNLSIHRGELLKPCPGTPLYRCCGYHILHVGLGCQFHCHYCILKDYLPSASHTVFVNVPDRLPELVPLLSDGCHRRIGTGEFTDSLALDNITRLSPVLISFFKTYPQVLLELKTKSVNIAQLVSIPATSNTIIAWSLNTPHLIARLEKGTPSLDARLNAAKTVSEHGFDTAFHFDPLVPYPDHESDYAGVIDKLFTYVHPEKVRWISLGMLRFTKGLKTAFYKLAPDFIDEMIVGDDNKYRFLRPRRVRLFQHLLRLIRLRAPHVYVYLCMESNPVWDEVFGYSFPDNAAFEKDFNARVFR